jgi:hypothetical protein
MTEVKSKVDAVLAKGATPKTCKWNSHDIKVMIQWFKRDGDKATPKNKEGVRLHYRKTHTHVVHHDRGAYPHGDMAAAIADASCFAFSSTSQQNTKAFVVAAAGYQAAAYAPPPSHSCCSLSRCYYY